MKNFPIIDKETEREYWISCSVAVVIIFIVRNKYGDSILVTQRGKGTPDPEYVGKYCLPCGYVDYDETVEEAASRELWEETGLRINPSNFKLLGINSNPYSDKRQNISIRFLYETTLPTIYWEDEFTTKNSEPNEISSVRFIDSNNIGMYEWAFNHDKLLINEIFKEERPN